MFFPFLFKVGERMKNKIMCIEDKFLREHMTQGVDKSIYIPDMLSTHTAYFKSERDACRNFYTPLHFATTLRTVYTNLVLCHDTKKGVQCILNLSGVPELPHQGYSLIMYLSSVALQSVIDYAPGFDNIIEKTEFQVIGFYNPNPEFIAPIVYSHILLDDLVSSMFPKFLKKGNHLETISYVKNKENNIITLQGLKDTLIEVHGGDNSGSNYS